MDSGDSGEWDVTAELACLKLDDRERRVLVRQAEHMRTLFLTMASVDEAAGDGPVGGRDLRADVCKGFSGADGLLDLAPESEDEFFLIPNVL